MKSRAFPYIPHTEEEIRRILHVIGVSSVEELLKVFPPDLRLKVPLKLPDGLSEQELKGLLEDISKKNSTTKDYSSFLGAGAYNHYIPSAVNHIISRSEFYTSYTPYQPEISQGTLQAIFEYQTLICQLTGMDAANASLYDGASAAAEAVLMAKRITGKKRVLVSSSLHPEYRETINTYLSCCAGLPEEVFYCAERGVTLPDACEKAYTDDTACMVVQHPNFFGCLEEVPVLSEIAHRKNSLLVVAVTEPVSFGMLKPPGEMGADIVVGEGQSFGNPLNFGGPYLGFMAAGNKNLRQLPGRIVGQTVDKNGKRSFCLTLATREQHIRRERATSNICTNEGLSALACAVHLSLLGKDGLEKLAQLNFSKAAYLKKKLTGVKGIKTAFTSPFFNEFVIEAGKDAEKFLKALLEKEIIGGVALKRFYPSLSRHILVTATEMNSKKDIDRYAEVADSFFGRC